MLRVLDGRRDALAQRLDAEGIATAVYYPRPLQLQPALASLGVGADEFPESARASRELLALPCSAERAADERDRVIAAVRAALAG